MESAGGSVPLEYKGRELRGELLDVGAGPVLLDHHRIHATMSWKGRRVVLVAYTVRGLEKLSSEDRETLRFRLPETSCSLEDSPPSEGVELQVPLAVEFPLSPAKLRERYQLGPILGQAPPLQHRDASRESAAGSLWVEPRVCVSGSPEVEPSILCYDILHEAGEDLLDLGIQREIAELILGGCFRGVSAGPVCSSFSCAVTPSWRSKEFPAGRPGLKTCQADKVRRGNAMLEFILNVVVLCERLEIVYIIENPLNSWMWAEPAWGGCKSRGGSWDFICDYCVFGTAWKKPTRFRTNGQLGGQRLRCSRNHRHLALRGRVAGRGISATKLAEPYPRRLCVLLAQALAQDAKWIADKRPLDISRCAKCSNCRIGEAQNPGPGRRAPRPDVQPQDIQLVQPATAALQNSVWAKFLLSVKAGTDDDGVAHATANPELLVELLCAYGQVRYSSGAPLQHYRQLLATAQRRIPQCKPLLKPGWETPTRWERLEPTQHRPPLPEPIFEAMCSLTLGLGWCRWACVTLIGFYGCCRIGEVLRATRAWTFLLTSRTSSSASVEIFRDMRVFSTEALQCTESGGTFCLSG